MNLKNCFHKAGAAERDAGTNEPNAWKQGDATHTARTRRRAAALGGKLQ